jgi:ubiquinone/menaquinone biosynthesis C-methylase UbiE
VALIEDAGHTEIDPETKTPLLVLASCPVDNRPNGDPRLSGKLWIRIKPGTQAFEAYGRRKTEENFSCNYELNPEYRPILERSGLIVSGTSYDGGARIVELPPHWFVGTGFLPQLSSEPGKPHPLIVTYLKAALALKKLKNHGSERPKTLENRWDILYRDYPEVYDEFASIEQQGKRWIDLARQIVSFKGKTVADIGSGSGKSTFELAEYTNSVIGIEPEDAMRELAEKNRVKSEYQNVIFKKGWAANIPLEDKSVDMTVSATGFVFFDAESARKFMSEVERITKPGGHILLVGIAPKWVLGGELTPLLLGKQKKDDMFDLLMSKFGFAHKDYYSISDFGSVDRAINIFGFIFGLKVINYLQKYQKSTIKWKMRIYYKQV